VWRLADERLMGRFRMLAGTLGVTGETDGTDVKAALKLP
jgi:hypothetical protein